MVNFILGVVTTCLFAFFLILAYNLGKKNNKKVEKEDISKEERENIKRINEGFQNIMNYSVDVALGKGKEV